MSEVSSSEERVQTRPLLELAALFLRLGATAFGGPAAHVALMADEVVRRRGWLTEQEFMDLLAASNMIPGPNSTEMAIHIGWHRGRWAGLLVAGACFILPSTILVWALAWAYVRYGASPEAEGLLYGVKPVLIAIVLQALVRLGPSMLRSRQALVIAGLAMLLSLWGMHEIPILIGGAIAMMVGRWMKNQQWPGWRGLGSVGPFIKPDVMMAVLQTLDSVDISFRLDRLFLVFAKIGSIMFGSGYVLIAFLRSDLVERYGWMTESELLDAVAVGQLTPGPVSTTATFIGYVLGGGWGALVATAGIFLPAFVFVAVTAPFLKRLRRSSVAAVLLDGLNVASLALMAAVTVQLAHTAMEDVFACVIAVAAAIAIFRYRVNSTWLVLGGAVTGLAAKWVGI